MTKSTSTRLTGPQPGAMVIIALGSNKPFEGQSPRHIIEHVLGAKLKAIGEVKAISYLYTSAAWPDPSDPPFINAAALMTSILPPHALLERLHAIEAAFGRQRAPSEAGSGQPHHRYAPRTLDLDILDYGGQILNFPRDTSATTAPVPAGSETARRKLILPHPAIAHRDFVLRPLADVCPLWQHPVTDETVTALLTALDRQGSTGTTKPLNTDQNPKHSP